MKIDLVVLITGIVLIIATINDLINRKISNYITIPAFFVGIVLTLLYDPKGIVLKIFFIALYFFIGMLGIIGLGDIKLLMAITCIYGVENTAYIFFGAVILLFLYCFITRPGETIKMIKNTINVFLYKTKVIVYSKEKYPFAVFMLSSFLVYESLRSLLSITRHLV